MFSFMIFFDSKSQKLETVGKERMAFGLQRDLTESIIRFDVLIVFRVGKTKPFY